MASTRLPRLGADVAALVCRHIREGSTLVRLGSLDARWGSAVRASTPAPSPAAPPLVSQLSSGGLPEDPHRSTSGTTAAASVAPPTSHSDARGVRPPVNHVGPRHQHPHLEAGLWQVGQLGNLLSLDVSRTDLTQVGLV